jgi:hypothetical protein
VCEGTTSSLEHGQLTISIGQDNIESLSNAFDLVLWSALRFSAILSLSVGADVCKSSADK